MLKDELCGVISNSDIGGGYRFLLLDAPKLAAELQPGQFIHVKVPGLEPSALRRPFSVFDAKDGVVTVLFKVVGRGTKVLAISPTATISTEWIGLELTNPRRLP